MIAIFLTVIGVLLFVLTLALAWWGSNLGCTMNITGCPDPGMAPFINMMTSSESLYWWLALALGAALIIFGLCLRCVGARRVDKRPPAP